MSCSLALLDNRLAVSSKHVSCVVDFRSDRKYTYGIDARVFSNTLDGDILTAVPSDTGYASNAWSVSSSTLTDSETDNDTATGRRRVHKLIIKPIESQH